MENIIKLAEQIEEYGFRFKEVNNKMNELEEDILLLGLADNVKESMYLIANGLDAKPKCEVCNKRELKFWGYKKGYGKSCSSSKCANEMAQRARLETFRDKYGVDNPYQSKEIKNKIKETLVERYGEDNPMKIKLIKNKIKKTNLERYGVENPYQKESVLKKIKDKYGDDFGFGSKFFMKRAEETAIKKYGVTHTSKLKTTQDKKAKTCIDIYGGVGMGADEIKKKIKATNLEKYGHECAAKNEKVKGKIKLTNIKRYGFPHPMQNLEYYNKHSKLFHKWKLYTFPSGRIEKVQGYEPKCLDELLKNGYDERDIVTSTNEIDKLIGKIMYSDGDKTRRYYPDIYVKSENKIYEVKSEYTLKCNLHINKLKKQACLDAGLDFEFKIY